MKKLAVIIVTYNSENHIYDCLNSIFKYNDIDKALEVIIIDNCSKEYEVMRQKVNDLYEGKVEVIANTKNGGYGQGNNIGIKASKSPIIIIMNPDVRLASPVFKTVCSIFDKRPNVVQIGLKQILPGMKYGYSFSWTTNVHPYISLPLLLITKKLDIFISKYMYFAGSCFCLRKSAFEEIGMFDENLFLYYEEEDVHQRLHQLNKNMFVYLRTGKYIHLHLPSKEDLDSNYTTFKQRHESLKYIFVKKGLTSLDAVKWEVDKFNMLILKEKLSYVLKRKNKNYINYITNWKNYLQEKL